MVSISGMAVSLKTDLRFPIAGQQGHGSWNIQKEAERKEKIAGLYEQRIQELFLAALGKLMENRESFWMTAAR